MGFSIVGEGVASQRKEKLLTAIFGSFPCLPSSDRLPHMTFHLLAQRLFEEFRKIDEFKNTQYHSKITRDRKAVCVFVSSAVLLTLMNFVVLSAQFQSFVSDYLSVQIGFMPEGWLRDFLQRLEPLYRLFAWSLGCLAVYFVMPVLIIRFGFREPLKNYGFSPSGFIKHLKVYVVLYIPVALAVALLSFTPQFQATYPFYHEPEGLLDFVLWEVLYCLQFFALEFFFRGFFIHALKWKLGYMAIFAMVVPYCMIHFHKPFLEALGAIVAGTVLGLLSLRTNTIWGGVVIHCAVAMTMDVASLVQRGVF
jgi:hypothetical protein